MWTRWEGHVPVFLKLAYLSNIYIVMYVCMQFKKIRSNLMFPKSWKTLRARFIAYGYYRTILLGYSGSCNMIKLPLMEMAFVWTNWRMKCYLISLYIQVPNLNVQTFGHRHKYLLCQICGFNAFACSFAVQEKDLPYDCIYLDTPVELLRGSHYWLYGESTQGQY